MRLQNNGTLFFDNEGNPMHCHGGHMLYADGLWYWYGEDRRDRIYVSVYASADLVHWEFKNHVLTMDSNVKETRVRADLSLQREDGGRVNIERPKVVYNEKTKKYVMWMHFENGKDYHAASAAVATCDTPDGDFVYHGSFRPYGQMSRDCTLFADGGTMYFLSASRDNADLLCYELQDDYLNVKKITGNYWSNEYREAPALVRTAQGLYCFSSFCTGWAPNQCRYGVTNRLEDGFDALTDVGDATTYRSQAAFILTVTGSETTSYIYVGDRWNARDYFASSYVFYPLSFAADGTVEMKECTAVDIDAATGRVSAICE